MADCKAMYLAAMDAMERAIETLTAAQQRCEDLYVASSGEEASLWPQAARPAKEMDPVHIFPINRDKENAVISRLFSMFSINLVQAKSSKNKGF